jgi:GNAT superfamily N-acetyltransferase
VRIRHVSDLDADWSQIWPLLDAYERHHASVLGGTLLTDREERSRKEIEHRRDTTLITVAEAGGQLVGTSFAYLRPPGKDGRRLGYGNRLYVEPSYRGLGLGARFEARSLRWLRDNGVTHLQDRFAQGNQRRRGIRINYEPVSVQLRKTL